MLGREERCETDLDTMLLKSISQLVLSDQCQKIDETFAVDERVVIFLEERYVSLTAIICVSLKLTRCHVLFELHAFGIELFAYVVSALDPSLYTTMTLSCKLRTHTRDLHLLAFGQSGSLIQESTFTLSLHILDSLATRIHTLNLTLFTSFTSIINFVVVLLL